MKAATPAVLAPLVVAVVAFAVVLTLGVDTRPADASHAELLVHPAASASGTYLADCAVCHGADGHGTNRGPTLVGVGRASVDYWVSTGRMPLSSPDEADRRHPPAYGPSLTRALVDYVTTLAAAGGPDIPDVDPSRGDISHGGEVYRLDCAACHQWSGGGGALLQREAPPIHASTATQIGEAVRIGPGLMPAFATTDISPHDLDSLAAYVRYLRNPDDRGGEPLWHLGPMAEGAIGLVFGLGLLAVAVRWIGERA